MSSTRLSAVATESTGESKPTPTHLTGLSLIMARAFWGIVALFELAAFVDGLTGTVSRLREPCTSVCANLQLSSGGVTTLGHLGVSLQGYMAFYLVVTLFSAVLCYAVAAILVWRRSNDWLALLVSLMLLSFSAGMISSGVRFSQWLAPVLAGHLSSVFDQINFTILILVFLLFPSGRFVPGWMRWILVASIAVGTYLVFFPRFTSGLISALTSILFLAILLCLAFAQLYRYQRVSTAVQRQQTKWIVYSLAVTVVSLAILLGLPHVVAPSEFSYQGSLWSSAPDILANAVLTLIPLSFGVAILRYRLWDIDTIINRTLIYGTLTLCLSLLYAGLILGLQFLSRDVIQQTSGIAVVVSTLVIAALFQPLRHRIQALIDRRFYRRKYDAIRTLAAFSATLQSEVDLEHLGEHLLQVIEETMQPASASLVLLQHREHTGVDARMSSPEIVNHHL